MLNFKSLSIAKRLTLLIGSAVLGTIVLAAIFLLSERTLMMQERQSAVRQTVEIGYNLIAHFHDQASKGAITEDEAKQRAMAAIKPLRYSGSEYFWINDMHPKMVMHSVRPDLDGKDLTENKDPTGKHLFVEFVNAVKAGGAGFVPYMWPKAAGQPPVQKVSYVKGFAPWGWIIGSGVYVDTVDTAMASRALCLAAGALVLAGLLLTIGIVIARGLLNQLGGEPSYAAIITDRIAAGDLSVDITLKNKDQSSMLHGIKALRDSFAGRQCPTSQSARSKCVDSGGTRR